MRLCVCGFLGLLLGSPAMAGNPAEAMNAALARIDVAHALAAAAQGNSEKAGALTEALAAYEEGLGALRAGLRANSLEISVLRASLLAEEAEIGRVLIVLQSLGRIPVGAGIRHPGGPLAAVHAGLSLAAALPDMQARAGELRTRLDDIARLNRLQDTSVLALREAMAAATGARKLILGGKSGNTSEAAAPLAEGLSSPGGASLNQVARLLADALADTPAAAIAPGGHLPPPVSGHVLRAFNTADAAGIIRPGIVMLSYSGAPVTAPAAATVRFAGAFPDYAQVVILEVRPGSLLVLAGLGVALVEEGESVAAGEIVALLAGNSGADEDNLIAIPKGNGSIRRETLYIETRENGEPVDPTTWLDLPAQ